MKIIDRIKGGIKCTREQPMYCASMVIIFVAMLILLHYIYMVIFPLRVMEINSIRVVDETIHPGETIELEMDWCSYASRDAEVHYRLVDGFVYTLPENQTTIPKKGCFDSHIRSVVVPEVTHPGTYYLQIEIVIKINSLRDKIINLETNKFTVVE